MDSTRRAVQAEKDKEKIGGGGPERHTCESTALDKQSYFNYGSKFFSLREGIT